MSMLTEFRLIPIARLGELERRADPGREDGEFYAFLERNSKELTEYNGSGYIYSALLEYLIEREIDLEESEYDGLAVKLSLTKYAFCTALTVSHKRAYLDKLLPSNFEAEELGAYYNEFNGTTDDEAEAGADMLEAIRVLHANLQHADGESVVLLLGV
ncbi:hypothetical protein [Saccharibacillus alkalitolerans]|uniref:DUF1877 family protein n=1 Tax=Saccharibacillus alkalitolerans TaxID=2705290 RepID=A0ABX0FC97_9BACL|nr:hypothetical protein [Saccharibacillus alkalitolerans]NGZ77674.1 hypothetical protein [Saccharibacillus alkalitolerans]